MEVDLFRRSCPLCDLVWVEYRFVFTGGRRGAAEGLSLSRLHLYNRERQHIPIVRTSVRGNLSFPNAPPAPGREGEGWVAVLDVKLEAPSEIMAYEIFTSHQSPARDPTSWDFGALFPDGSFIVLRGVKQVSPPWERGASYGYEPLGSFVRPAARLPAEIHPWGTLGPTGNCSELLLLLLRGDTFRKGGSGERGVSEAVPQLQVLTARLPPFQSGRAARHLSMSTSPLYLFPPSSLCSPPFPLAPPLPLPLPLFISLNSARPPSLPLHLLHPISFL